MWFQVDIGIANAVLEAAESCKISMAEFVPDVRQADPRFGDFQVNGMLPYAKLYKLNPRHIAEQIIKTL
jgi:arginyl-tRNA synthetase